MSLRSGSSDSKAAFNSEPALVVRVVDPRCHPRFKLEVALRVYARDSAVVRGHSVDLSESGISAMLREELGLDEVVPLEFNLPHGEVELHALVRQRNAFRCGFQFQDASAAHDVMGGPAAN